MFLHHSLFQFKRKLIFYDFLQLYIYIYIHASKQEKSRNVDVFNNVYYNVYTEVYK